MHLQQHFDFFLGVSADGVSKSRRIRRILLAAIMELPPHLSRGKERLLRELEYVTGHQEQKESGEKETSGDSLPVLPNLL